MDASFCSFLLSDSLQTQIGLRLLIASVELAFLAFALGFVLSFRWFRSPRLRAFLWALVLLKPLITLLAGSPFVLARFEIAPEVIQSTAKPVDSSLYSSMPSPEFLARTEKSSSWIEASPAPTASTRKEGAWWSIPLRPGWFLAALTFCWLVGICVGALRWVLGGYRLRCIVSRAEEPARDLLELFNDEAVNYRFERIPRLMITSELESPVLFGALKPLILLPAWLVDSDEAKLRHLFGHELNHHRHRDALMLALGQLSLVLFFFNPVAHWVYRQWLCCAELSCDRSVVDSNGEAREYARELFSVLEGMQKREVTLSGLYATRFQIGTRVNALLENPMSVRANLQSLDRVLIFAFGIVLLSLGIGVTEDWGDDSMYFGLFDESHAWQRPLEPTSSETRRP